MTKFIRVGLGTFYTMHGFNEQLQALQTKHEVHGYVDTLIAVDRIQSVTEQFILLTGSHGRVSYWEYNGSLEDILSQLQALGCSI